MGYIPTRNYRDYSSLFEEDNGTAYSPYAIMKAFSFLSQHYSMPVLYTNTNEKGKGNG